MWLHDAVIGESTGANGNGPTMKTVDPWVQSSTHVATAERRIMLSSSIQAHAKRIETKSDDSSTNDDGGDGGAT